jgi:hypothetical protein
MSAHSRTPGTLLAGLPDFSLSCKFGVVSTADSHRDVHRGQGGVSVVLNLQLYFFHDVNRVDVNTAKALDVKA